MGGVRWLKRKALTWAIHRALVRLQERIVFENIHDLLKTKTFWGSVFGVAISIAIGLGQQDIADQLKEGAKVVATEGWMDDLRWMAAFATAIFLRLGVLKK